MDKLAKIQHILSQVEDQITEILNEESLEDLSPEEIVQLALELAVNQIFNQPKFSTPIATVDKEKIQFVIDDEFQIPLYSEELLYGDDED